MTTTTFRSMLLVLMTCITLPATAMQTAASAAIAPAPAPAPAPAAVYGVDVALDTLDSYAGSYVIGPGFEVKVWRDDERLMLQATGQEAWPLIAESEAVFAVPSMEARISFGFDARGRVDQLVMYADGKETRALRR